MTLERICAKTEEYLNLPSVVGHEGAFLKYLEAEFSRPGRYVELHDGLLSVRPSGTPAPFTFCAHADRHGLITAEYGALLASAESKRIRGIDGHSDEVLERFAQRFLGQHVIAHTAEGRRVSHGMVENVVRFEGLHRYLVQWQQQPGVGLPVAYKNSFLREGATLSGQLDNALSIAVLKALHDDGFDGTLLFPAEEESGNSHVHLAGYVSRCPHARASSLVDVDLTPVQDSSYLDGRLALRRADSFAIFDPLPSDQVRLAAEALVIPTFYKDDMEGKLGKTQAGRLARAHPGIRIATLQMPSLNYHTNHETVSERAASNAYIVLQHLANHP